MASLYCSSSDWRASIEMCAAVAGSCKSFSHAVHTPLNPSAISASDFRPAMLRSLLSKSLYLVVYSLCSSASCSHVHVSRALSSSCSCSRSLGPSFEAKDEASLSCNPKTFASRSFLRSSAARISKSSLRIWTSAATACWRSSGCRPPSLAATTLRVLRTRPESPCFRPFVFFLGLPVPSWPHSQNFQLKVSSSAAPSGASTNAALLTDTIPWQSNTTITWTIFGGPEGSAPTSIAKSHILVLVPGSRVEASWYRATRLSTDAQENVSSTSTFSPARGWNRAIRFILSTLVMVSGDSLTSLTCSG
mmetsp:Transcript_61293/g.164259  ORF Transcript_61293/g.164259 Transcript_61293/m.164259 type:complete len:305 (+) Transcript_61293:134-1048(+)